MFKSKSTIIAGLGVFAVGIIAGAILFSASPEAEIQPNGRPAEIDMTIPSIGEQGTRSRPTRDGCVRPPRPDWAIDAAPRDTFKVSLLLDLYEIDRKKAIIESNSCPCDVQFPSWDAAQSEYDTLTANVEGDFFTEIMRAKSSEAAKLNKPALDVCETFWGRR